MDLLARLRALTAVDGLDLIAPPALLALAERGRPHELADGQRLSTVRGGEPVALVVAAGEVGAGGVRHRRGALLGLPGALDADAPGLVVRARGAARVLELDGGDLVDTLAAHPAAALELARRLAAASAGDRDQRALVLVERSLAVRRARPGKAALVPAAGLVTAAAALAVLGASGSVAAAVGGLAVLWLVAVAIAARRRAAADDLGGGAAPARRWRFVDDRELRDRLVEATDDGDAALAAAARAALVVLDPGRRPADLAAAAAGGEAGVARLVAALAAGEPDAAIALASLDDAAERNLRAELPLLPPDDRASVALALAAGEAHSRRVLAALVEDDDLDVQAAALRALVAHARAGEPSLPALGTRLAERERRAVLALAAARPAPGAAPALHVAELERALAAAVERLLAALALVASAAGRPPGPVLATGRRLLAADPAARARALQRLPRLAPLAPEVLATLERALRPAVAADPRARDHLEPWLAALLAGAHAAREPALAALRACPIVAALPGRHADDLAARATRRYLATGDVLARAGDPAAGLHCVVSGTLTDGARRHGPGAWLAAAALVDDAVHDATLRATSPAQVLIVDRATFAAAIARWPALAAGACRALAATTFSSPAAARPSKN